MKFKIKCYYPVKKKRKSQQQGQSAVMFTICIFLPSGDRGDERGGSEDLAGANGMCGRGLREVGTGWRDCEVMEGEKACQTTNEGNYTESEAIKANQANQYSGGF